jgi:phosphatidate cytidylyltransferase
MTPETRARLFDCGRAFDHPVTVIVTAAVAAVVLVAPAVIALLGRAGKLRDGQRAELWSRYRSWLVLIPLIIGPILLGAAWTIAAAGLLSVLCYREFARATGLFREKLVSFVVVLGILAEVLAAADHWYDLFVALFPLTAGSIAACGILRDEPKGYIQRVGLGFLAFALFGSSMGHLAYFANDANYRPMLLFLFFSVQMNDVFAYVVGKSLGRRKLAPNTSPNKTVEGAAGALVLTTALAGLLGHHVFRGTQLDRLDRLLMLGLIVSAVGMLGDLMLSSIKRDLGIKDMGAVIPGHGGVLDRFNSTILVAPAFFHFVGYFVGVGLDQEIRIFTGSGMGEP